MDYIEEYIKSKTKSSGKREALRYARLDRLGVIFDPNLPSVAEANINLRALKFYFYRYRGMKMICKCEQPNTQPNCTYDPKICKLNAILIFDVIGKEEEGTWLLKTSKISSLANLYAKKELTGKCKLKTFPITDNSDFRTIDLEPLENEEALDEIEEIALSTPITEKTKRLILTIPSAIRLSLMDKIGKQSVNELTEEEAQQIIKMYKEGETK